jgi:hypothetical protein
MDHGDGALEGIGRFSGIGEARLVALIRLDLAKTTATNPRIHQTMRHVSVVVRVIFKVC